MNRSGVWLALGVALLSASPAQAAESDDPIQIYQERAAEGDVIAQYNLGVVYAAGQGVPQNDAEAALWYRKAAEQGYAKAGKFFERAGGKIRNATAGGKLEVFERVDYFSLFK